jgi:hypothetical protein
MILPLRYQIILSAKQFKKWPRHRPLFRPRTNHTCHQRPNPSRETDLYNKSMIFSVFVVNVTYI